MYYSSLAVYTPTIDLPMYYSSLVLATCYPLSLCMLITLVNYTKYIIVFMNALNVTGSNVTNIRIECNMNNNITLIQ